MNPDLAAAVSQLVADGVLPAGRAEPLLRQARGELVSVRAELRALLYLGVLIAMAGIGLLVEQNLDRIGPLAIATGIGAAALAALGWVARVSPPFSWQEVPAPNLAFDYILLLGVLLAAADLAYLEVRFAPLGAFHPWHLLVVAVLAGAAAFRFDSRVVLSLALSAFAAWRGVALSRQGVGEWLGAGAVRWNAVACGALFAAGGLALARTRRKAHFEPLAVNLGWLLILAGLVTGFGEEGRRGPAWGAALLAVGAALAAGAFRRRRFPLFAMGVLAAYAGLCRLFAAVPQAAELACFFVAVSSLLVLAGLVAGQRAMRAARPADSPAAAPGVSAPPAAPAAPAAPTDPAGNAPRTEGPATGSGA